MIVVIIIVVNRFNGIIGLVLILDSQETLAIMEAEQKTSILHPFILIT